MSAVVASLAGVLALAWSAVRVMRALPQAPFGQRVVYALLPISKLLVVVFACGLCTLGGRPQFYAVFTGIVAVLSAGLDNVVLKGLIEAERLNEAALMEQALSEQVELQQKHLAAAQGVSAEAAKLSADILAQRADVTEALDAADADAALAALEGLVGAATPSHHHYCENKAMDALVGSKAASCERVGIDLRAQLLLGDLNTEADAALCAVVANLLDNAIAACQALDTSERWIELNLTRKGAITTVRVKNPVAVGPAVPDDKREVRAAGGLPQHGWGQRIVASIAERSGGTFMAGAQDGVYTASVILNG